MSDEKDSKPTRIGTSTEDNDSALTIEEPNHLHNPIEDDSYGSTSNTRNILILIGVTVFLFAMMIGGFSLYNQTTSAGVLSLDQLHQDNLEGRLNENYEGYVYNGFSFVKAEGLWWTEINKFGTRLKVPLHFAPQELEQVAFTGNLDPAFNEGEEVYVAIDPEVVSEHYTLAISELSFNLVKGMDRRPVGSCIKNHEACKERQIINCETANGRPVIELAISETPEIELKGTCVKVKGTGFDLVKGVNRILYQWYGVMS